MGVSRTSFFWVLVRFLMLSVAIFGILVGWRLMTSSRIAEAATDTYYPSFCLGGWDKPRHASGPVETGNGNDPNAFTLDNSAFLASDISSQIFCGYFPVEPRDNPPASADILLVWNFQGAPEASVPSAPLPAPMSPAETTSDATATPQAPTVGALSTPPESDTTPAASSSETETAPAPKADSNPPSPADTTPPAPAAEQPAPPAPTTPADAAPTSLLQTGLRVAGTWISTHTPIAHAQENSSSPISLSDWFEVSYSLDGVRWKSLGRVNAGNWKDFTVHIPLSSWDDLQNVQIMVAALPSLSERPPVYLDGMELRVDAPLSISETASAAASAANDMVDSAADAIASLGSSIASLFGDESQPAPSTDPAPAPTASPPPAPTPKVLKRMLQFTVSGNTIPVSSRLPWQDKETQDDLASTTRTNSPEVSRSDDGRSFIVSGSCSKEFATVITYRNETDYRDNPRNALANVATPCENGHYTFNLGGLPDSTLGGTYYLLIGEQSATSTWTPSSALLPITIQPVEVEE